MFRLPRLALGALQPGVDTHPLCWALMELFFRRACQVQHFSSQACFCSFNGALSCTGLSSRQLDSWLMSRSICRELFVRGMRTSDLAVVEGRFEPPGSHETSGGRLDVLCQWLDLPRLGVLDVSRLHDCALPTRPAQLDGLLLDRVGDTQQFFRLQTLLESIWGVPVLGALEELPSVRAAMATLSCGHGHSVEEISRRLGSCLARYVCPERILKLAGQREFPDVVHTLFQSELPRPDLKVAVAYDEVFNCHFLDMLDLMEYLGAAVTDFSPLHDERPPPDADIIYLGCGRPQHHAAALAENLCMLQGMRNHLCSGRRIYAEGGGLAYLCQHLQTPDGQRWPMVGALPAVARISQGRRPLLPLGVTLDRGNWLARPEAHLRGYLNPNWQLEPTGPMTGYVADPGHERDLIGNYRALGSRLQMNFAAQPDLLGSFFEPHACGPALPVARLATG